MHGTRRAGGSRSESTERVQIRRDTFSTNGWTLNISRGGARLVLEDPVELGAEYDVEMAPGADAREVRVIWVQDEADGQIVGIQFLDTDGSLPPAPAAPGGPRTVPPKNPA